MNWIVRQAIPYGFIFEKETGKAEISYEEVGGCTTEEFRRGDVDELKGFQEITCNIVFGVKMDFTFKSRYAIDASMTDTPGGLCYSSVVSFDSVRIEFLVAALNDLYILACEISNTYINAPCGERIFCCCRDGMWKES